MVGIMQMVANNIAPSIPTPTVYLDAMSYSGSGTTWTAQNGSDATLVNTPTFVTPSPTYFSFAAASGEKATAPNLGNLTTWTVECWFRPTSALTSTYSALVTDQYNGSNAVNFCLGFNQNGTTVNPMQVGFFDGSWHLTSGYNPTLNTWCHGVGTYDGSTIKMYINGSLHSQLSYSGTPQSSGLGYRIAARWDSQVAPNDFFPGDIGLVRIWNSALFVTQVQTLYNQNLARFSLTPTITSFTTAETTTWTAPAGVSKVQYLVVAGGGGAGNAYDNAGGGGGAGGMVLSDYLNVVPGTTYTVTVGAGGAGGADARANNPGTAGSNSVLGSITALGGGQGLGSRTGGTAGAAQVGSSTAPTGGSGSGGGQGGKGGGGAGGAGSTNSGATGGASGAGTASSITGSSVTYGVGGAGGGAGAPTTDGTNGTANTGNGGQGGKSNSNDSSKGGDGGSGIVVVSYGS